VKLAPPRAKSFLRSIMVMPSEMMPMHRLAGA
jgi:hypothetical protein